MHLKVLHKFFSANLKTLDKATLIGIVWNYILEESIKKNWETQMFGKIHSEPCQTSETEIFTKIVGYQKPLTIFLKASA